MRYSMLLIVFATALVGRQASYAQTVWMVNADYIPDPLADRLNFDGDTNDGICDTGNVTDGFTGRCTLAAALGESDDGDIIRFDPSLTVIFPIALVELPTSATNLGVFVNTSNITIDGLIGTSRRMIIDFSLLGRIFIGGADCFKVDSLGVTFKNLEIRNCNRWALHFESANSFEDGRDGTIQSNYIHDNRGGIWFYDARISKIGGPTPVPGTGLGNIISANGSFGGITFNTTKIGGGFIDADCSGTTVEGNLIGADLDGPAGNGSLGILIGCNGVQIGGPDPLQRNIISNNGFEKHPFSFDSGSGVEVRSAKYTVIQGNYIGTDPSGQLKWGNAESGIYTRWAGLDDPNPGSGGTIGGDQPGAGNLISNNGHNGVLIESDRVTVVNNIIGTGLDGTTDRGNGWSGVLIDGSVGNASNNLIGGSSTNHRNLISGNRGNGVLIKGPQAVNNHVEGNYIGTDILGLLPLGNDSSGVWIDNSSNNVVGGLTINHRNLISGNRGDGVLIKGLQAKNNRVEGNYIGTNVSGFVPLGNDLSGVRIDNAPDNIVGGLTIGFSVEPGNIIRANKEFGICIWGTGSVGNKVQSNTVGNPDNEELLNTKRGIAVADGATKTMIGGEADEGSSYGNSIYDGVTIAGATTTGISVLGNKRLEIPADWMSGPDMRVPLDLGKSGPSCYSWENGEGVNMQMPPPRILNLTTGSVDGMTRPGAKVEIYRVNTDDTGTDHARYFPRIAEPRIIATANENGFFTANLDVQVGQMVVATATDADGNTSELSQLRRPVIAVPGIGGSWIEDANSGRDLWVPLVTQFDFMILNLLDRLALDINGGPGPGPTRIDGMLEGITVFEINAAYKEWLNGLEDSGYVGDSDTWIDAQGTNNDPGNELKTDLWRMPNDWRLNQSLLAADLIERIDWLTDASNDDVARSCEVDLLSHSNGGVIVGTYLRSEPEHSRTKVHRSVEMSVPYWGALKGLMAHTLGYVFELETALPGFDVGNWGRIIAMTRNIPAAYTLMPSEDYWRGSGQFGRNRATGREFLLQNYTGRRLGSYNATQNFLTANKAGRPWGLQRNGPMWTLVRDQVNRLIGDWSMWEGPPQIYRLYGRERGAPTTPIFLNLRPDRNIGFFDFFGKRAEPGLEDPLFPADGPQHQRYREHLAVVFGRGDGTVPTSSATLGRINGRMDLSGIASEWLEEFEEYPCTHLGIADEDCANETGTAIGRIAEILSSGYTVLAPSANKNFAQDRSSDPPYDVFYINMSRSVEIHIVDASGNHTGPSGNPSPENFERNVPGIGYSQNDFTATISLPSGTAHTLTIRAAESESVIGVSRVLGGYQADNLHVLFPDQYVAQNGAIEISLVAGGTSDSTPFLTDADGDGSFEGVLDPATSFTSDSPSPAVPYPVPYQIHAGANPSDTDPISVMIEFPDLGGPQWSWEVTSPSAWINPEQSSGTTPGELQLILMSNTLVEGSYTDTTEVVLRLNDYQIEVPVLVHLGVFETLSLSRIELSTPSITLSPGQTHLFAAYGFDQTSQNFEFTPVWSAQKGQITSDGLYTAAGEEGIDVVVVTDENGLVKAEATVEVSLAVNVDTIDQSAIPEKFQLYGAYPNPFKLSAQIPFDVTETVHVSLKVYDIIGREVRTLIRQTMQPGRYEARFDPGHLPSGVYFFRIVMGEFHQVKKMILLR